MALGQYKYKTDSVTHQLITLTPSTSLAANDMAPSLKKALKAFIDEIPAAKLQNFPGSPGTLHKDDNFRLDLQVVSVLLHRGVSRPFTHQNIPLRSSPRLHTTCKSRRTRARQIHQSEKPRPNLWLPFSGSSIARYQRRMFARRSIGLRRVVRR